MGWVGSLSAGSGLGWLGWAGLGSGCLAHCPSVCLVRLGLGWAVCLSVWLGFSLSGWVIGLLIGLGLAVQLGSSVPGLGWVWPVCCPGPGPPGVSPTSVWVCCPLSGLGPTVCLGLSHTTTQQQYPITINNNNNNNHNTTININNNN